MPTADRFQSIFMAARSYALSARRLNIEAQRGIAAPESTGYMLLPSHVLAALALELHYKALYYLEFARDFKVSGRHSHDFSKLFLELPRQTRDELERRFESVMAGRNMTDVEGIEQFIGVKIGRTLVESLSHWSDVFVKVRYFFEPNESARPMLFFDELEASVLEVLRGRRPDMPL